MESSLLFFFVGLAIFGVNRLVAHQPEWVRMVGFLSASIAAGFVVGLIAGTPWPESYHMPLSLVPAITGMAGILLYFSEKGRMITRPGIQYMATVLLGLMLTGLSYGFVWIYRHARGLFPLSGQGKQLLFMLLLLVSFLTVFGYTFPERWFKRTASEKPQE